MSQELVATIAFAGGLVATAVDGRWAVAVAALAAGGSLALPASTGGGTAGAVIVLGTAAGSGIAGALASWVARRAGWVAGLDPLIPVVAPPPQLFGPRSLRVVLAALAVPASSWIAFNLSSGEVQVPDGALFAAAYLWMCGAGRLVLARTIEDLGAAACMVGLAASTAWMLLGGSGSLGGAAAAAALAPLAGLTAGWLGGRHERRESLFASLAGRTLSPRGRGRR